MRARRSMDRKYGWSMFTDVIFRITVFDVEFQAIWLLIIEVLQTTNLNISNRTIEAGRLES